MNRSIVCARVENGVLGLAVAVISALLLTLAGCKKDEDPKPLPLSERLPRTRWKLESLKIDGTAEAVLYKDMTLAFQATRYTSESGAPIFKATGAWKWKDGDVVVLDNDLEVMVKFPSDSRMTLALTWDETVFEPGRSKSLSGEHEFTFVAVPWPD